MEAITSSADTELVSNEFRRHGGGTSSVVSSADTEVVHRWLSTSSADTEVVGGRALGAHGAVKAEESKRVVDERASHRVCVV